MIYSRFDLIDTNELVKSLYVFLHVFRDLTAPFVNLNQSISKTVLFAFLERRFFLLTDFCIPD